MESYFQTIHYVHVLNRLSDSDKEKCKDLTYGDIFTNYVDGCAWLEQGYSFISLNYSLNYFLNFCNLAFLNFKSEIPPHVKQSASIIATRIFLRTEAMDFDLDPRGKVNKTIKADINSQTKYIMQFIAGHEFSHHLCGHLKENSISEKKLFNVGNKNYTTKVYNKNQQNEFEADINSLLRPEYSEKEYANIYKAALIWFMYLNFAEEISEVVSPSDPYGYKTHPSAKERFYHILENAKEPSDINFDELQKLNDKIMIYLKHIKEEISTNYSLFDTYGSVYLDEPNTRWRGRKLIDRVDY